MRVFDEAANLHPQGRPEQRPYGTNRGGKGLNFDQIHSSALAGASGEASVARAFSWTMNCARANSAKRPPLATSSSKVPLSITRPASNTRIRVALRMVESR